MFFKNRRKEACYNRNRNKADIKIKYGHSKFGISKVGSYSDIIVYRQKLQKGYL